MKSSNMTFMSILTVPYKVGIAGGLISAAVTIPLCFDLNTALWFNECYVTTDVPEGKDLETWLEDAHISALSRCTFMMRIHHEHA